jgi:hypothetical protein
MARRCVITCLLLLFLLHCAGDVWTAGRLPHRATPRSPSDDAFYPLALSYREEALARITPADVLPPTPVEPALSPNEFARTPGPDEWPDTSPGGPDRLYALMSLRR